MHSPDDASLRKCVETNDLILTQGTDYHFSENVPENASGHGELSASATPADKVNATEVSNFLRVLGLEKYSLSFAEQEIHCLSELSALTDNDYFRIGVKIGDRLKIQKACLDSVLNCEKSEFTSGISGKSSTRSDN